MGVFQVIFDGDPPAGDSRHHLAAEAGGGGLPSTSTTLPTACGPEAGRCPPTPCPKTPRTSWCSASWSARALGETWPSCWWEISTGPDLFPDPPDLRQPDPERGGGIQPQRNLRNFAQQPKRPDREIITPRSGHFSHYRKDWANRIQKVAPASKNGFVKGEGVRVQGGGRTAAQEEKTGRAGGAGTRRNPQRSSPAFPAAESPPRRRGPDRRDRRDSTRRDSRRWSGRRPGSRCGPPPPVRSGADPAEGPERPRPERPAGCPAAGSCR